MPKVKVQVRRSEENGDADDDFEEAAYLWHRLADVDDAHVRR